MAYDVTIVPIWFISNETYDFMVRHGHIVDGEEIPTPIYQINVHGILYDYALSAEKAHQIMQQAILEAAHG